MCHLHTFCSPTETLESVFFLGITPPTTINMMAADALLSHTTIHIHEWVSLTSIAFPWIMGILSQIPESKVHDMGLTWGPMLAPWTLLSGIPCWKMVFMFKPPILWLLPYQVRLGVFQIWWLYEKHPAVHFCGREADKILWPYIFFDIDGCGHQSFHIRLGCFHGACTSNWIHTPHIWVYVEDIWLG